MLTLLLGADWTENRDTVLRMLANDVAQKSPGRILLVPELISHDMERRLCATAGDTCSRFAEVVSFSRLARRICDWAQCGMQPCLDNGGRLVALASAARQLHGQLKSYASVETRPEFLTGLIDAIDEFKRCCISAEDLDHAAKQSTGAFAQKLEELSLLYQAYDGICSHGLRDPRDQLAWCLEKLLECDFAEKHVFYIDGFPDFTRQNMAIIAHLIEKSPNVTISMNCDAPGSKKLQFEKAGDTVSQLLRIAEQCRIPVQIKHVPVKDNTLHSVTKYLFQGKPEISDECKERIRLVQAESVYDECVMAVDEILDLVHQGVRYRDISVVCPDLTTYSNALHMHLQLCGIPAYLSGTEDILDNTAISTVMTALDAALDGFSLADIMRYIKSALAPVDLETCDQIENYARKWNIQGKKWLTPWTMHPQGLQDIWQEQDIRQLEALNHAREFVIKPLEKLSHGFENATKLNQQVEALYQFLNEIHLADRLELLATEMDAAGDNRSAQILNQHWEILLTAMQQLQDVLGETAWDSETFSRLFRLLLSQYDVGTIPPVLDTVIVGPVSAMRCNEAKHLIILGATEGYFPSYGGITGVLSDQERNALRQMGIPLTGGAADGLQIEFSEIYGVFCGAKESIYLSCHNGQGSFIYRRLLEMTGQEYHKGTVLTAASVNKEEAAAYLCRLEAETAAKQLSVSQLYEQMLMKRDHNLGSVSKKEIDGLYGQKLNLSASQIDQQAQCRLAYFLKYGLRAKEQKTISVDPAEFGTYVHAVLENTAREICQLGGFKSVTLPETIQIAQKYSDAYTKEHFSQIDSERIAYLFHRNNRELMMVVEELWAELQNSSFVPIDFEVAFGNGKDLDAIQIDGSTMPAQLRGFVDRVDAWQEDGRNYFRVVDYKTGKKDFDYCDILNGLGLQMLLYLFALQQQGEGLLGENPIPAGVQYFPARVPILSADSDMSDEEAKDARVSLWKRKGLILGDDDVLFAMENSDTPVRLSCKRKKDGTLTGDIATKEQFTQLKRYVFRLLGNMVDEIASGNVTPNPYTRGSSHNACRFCPYGAVCHSATVADRRDFKAVSSQRFWEEIGKEAEANG